MKKLPTVILTSSLLMGGVALPACALEAQVSVVSNQVLEPALLFTLADGATSRIGFAFDGTERGLQLRQLVLAAYNYAEFSQKTVEENLAELGGEAKPAWARIVRNLTPELAQEGYIQAGSAEMTDGEISETDPGLFYYAAQIQKGTEEPYWIRGKIDYRRCTYQDSSVPHNTQTCTGKLSEDGQNYVFEQREGVVRDPSDPYVEWGDELGRYLTKRLESVDHTIVYWFGDTNFRADAMKVLQEVEDTMEDASNQAELRAQLDEYYAIFDAKGNKFSVNAKIWNFEREVEEWEGDEDDRERLTAELKKCMEELAAGEKAREYLRSIGKLSQYMDENTAITGLVEAVERVTKALEEKTAAYDLAHPKPVEKPTQPVQPTESTEPTRPTGPMGNGGSSTSAGQTGNAGLGAAEDNNGEADGTEESSDEDEAPEEKPEVSEVPGSVITRPEEGKEIAQVGEIKENDQEAENLAKNDQWSVSGADEAAEAGIPALSEPDKAEKGSKWYILPVVGLVLAVGAGIWWLKRAFGGRKSLKN